VKQKKNKFKIKHIWIFFGVILLVFLGLTVKFKIFSSEIKSEIKENKEIEVTPTIMAEPTPTPTPKPISLEEMNAKYGPCAKVFVLTYHHVQDEEIAKKRKQTNLNVTPEFFRKHLQYLKDKNYNVIGMTDLKNFFDNGTALPSKSVLITLDDGYKDNYENAYPILKEFGYRATIFIPTGLLNNSDYLTWGDLENMKDLVYMGNHTWSHQSSSGLREKQDQEIGLADKQLSEHGFNNIKIFAYPYGKPSSNSEDVLKNKGYEIAFTTTHGTILCKKKSLELPRVRISDAPLSNFGL